MIGRRRVLKMASGSLLVPALAGRRAFANPGGGGGAGADGGGGLGTPDEVLLDYLPLRLYRARLAIASMFILFGSQLFMLRAAQGVTQRNENRLDLGGLPLFGNLIRRAYQPEDFTPATRIGRAYVDGATLFVYLFPELAVLPLVHELILLNAAYSYTMRDDYQARDWAALTTLMVTFCAIPTVQRAVQARLAGTAPATSPDSSTITPAQMDSMVLGGLIKDDRGDQSRGIPGLADIPALNRHFAGDVHTHDAKKLLVLLRPSIIMGDKEY